MCVQTGGLLAAAIERAGITTTSVTLLKEVTSIIQPPRALFAPFPMGYPLGAPHDSALQHQVIAAALDLLSETGVPLLKDFAAPSQYRER